MRVSPQNIPRCRVPSSSPPPDILLGYLLLSLEQPCENDAYYGQHCAQDETAAQRKVEGEISLLNEYIARKLAHEPRLSTDESYKSDNGENTCNYEKHLPYTNQLHNPPDYVIELSTGCKDNNLSKPKGAGMLYT